jgi:adenylate cyclase
MHFNEAEVIFRQLASEYEDGPSFVFAERCEAFLAEPPEDGWDGVFTLKSK